MSWAYTIEKLRERIKDIKAAMVRQSVPLSGLKYHVGDMDPVSAASAGFDDSAWTPLPENRCWGKATETTAWLRTSIVIPDAWKGHTVVVHVKGVDCETLAYVDGTPVQAFDGAHFDMVLSDTAVPGKTYSLTLEAYSGLQQRFDGWNPYFGTAPGTEHSFSEADVRLIDKDTYDLAFDFDFAYQAALTMDKNGREYAATIDALDETYNLLDLRQGATSERFYASVKPARAHLQNTLYKKHHAPELAPTIWSTGHAHIDTAWLWRLAHTRKKCLRTFNTALEIAKRYPDYVFSCSQPQQYQYVKEDSPELYERIKKAVKAGNWQPIGGMWVESDCNVVSGESLVRQFVYGLRFFKEEFDIHTNVVWLPDVFGYSAAFPQIIRKAGMKYFMTIKIFWSQVNKPPYQTFKWVGIDGTDVLTHFSPLGDYNAVMTPEQIRANWDRYNQKHLSDSNLLIYGYGDGGGGATYEMLEFAERAKDFIDFPKVKLASPEAFFEDLDKQVSGKPQLPVWNGELYLELHRGTYTSQGRNKRANRQAEFLYQTAEHLSSLATLLTGAPYPTAAIDEGWKLILLNQFHDIIPGSSIGEVYIDSTADYAHVKDLGDAAVDTALATLAGQVEGEGTALVYNPLSWPRRDVVALPASLGLDGQAVVDLDGNPQTLVELGGQVPSLGYANLGGYTASPISEPQVFVSYQQDHFDSPEPMPVISRFGRSFNGPLNSDESPVSRFVNMILTMSIGEGATAILLERQGEHMVVAHKFGAVTRRVMPISGVILDPVTAELKKMANVTPEATSDNQTGTITIEGYEFAAAFENTAVGEKIALELTKMPAIAHPDAGYTIATTTGLENKYWTLRLDKNGEIESLIDKRNGREVIDSSSYCKGNALLAFEDRPMFWEAWDMDIFYNDKMYPIQTIAEIKVIETGPIRAGIEIKRTVDGGRGSTIRQRIFVYRDMERIDFETELDWHEHQTLLKVAFPVTVNALKATYDIQFGSIERPTHWNTTWDWAQFEVCGQKWADLSEGDYGVSLLSDSKYGWDIRGNVMRLSLLKSAISPDPDADQGIHRFTYSLYPHAGDWREAQSVRRAYELNVPVKTAPKHGTGTLPATFSLVSTQSPNIVIETIKKAEDDDSLIVRFYDAHNQRGTATLQFARPIKSAKAVNLLENEPDGEQPTVDGATVSVSYHPFEIRTLKVVLELPRR